MDGADLIIADARAFDDVQLVLRGERRFDLGAQATKVLRILFHADTQRDVVIEVERFAIHFGRRKQHRPARYFKRLAPPVMSEIMRRAQLDVVVGPVVIRLPAGRIQSVSDQPAQPHNAKLVWIVPGIDEVKMIVRPNPDAHVSAFHQPIPREGPLALQELPDWSPTFQDFAEPVACKACGHAEKRYRAVGGALVCPACCRSFEP